MGMPPRKLYFESYQGAEREVLKAFLDTDAYRPMSAIDQAIVVAAAARLLYNARQRFPNTHGLGGAGAVEATLQTFKYLKLTPSEFAARLGESDTP